MNLLRRSLFLRISLAFLVLATVFGVAQTLVFLSLWNSYNEETEQRVHWDLAGVMAEQLQPQLAGPVDHRMIQRALHQLASFNPSVEPFLVDSAGRVVAGLQDGPMRPVDLASIEAFLNPQRPPGKPLKLALPNSNDRTPQVFSAARVVFEGKDGFLILFLKGRWASEVRMHLGDLYSIRLIVTANSVAIIFAVALAGVVFYFITRHFLKISAVVAEFERGDYSARAYVSGDDEVGRLGRTFNQMADTIELTISQLARSDELRRELVANITHDIRRPITSLHAKLQTFLSQYRGLSELEQFQLIESLIRALNGMNMLIDDLFELSKLNADERKPVMKTIELAPLIDDVCERLRHRAEERKITLSFAPLPHSTPVSSDPMLLDRVLANLVENALIYTPPSGTIELRLIADSEGVGLTIRDTGVGISADDLPHIFEPYFRAKSAQEQVPSGSGLGLAIVKKIAERLRIRISVESIPGIGTTFTLRFP